MHVQERFHRVDQDNLELTVTIDDGTDVKAAKNATSNPARRATKAKAAKEPKAATLNSATSNRLVIVFLLYLYLTRTAACRCRG